jgi:hypothetical protein
MKHFMILAGATALAFAAPVLAEKGGKGNGNGGGKPAKVERGGGGGQSAKKDRGAGPKAKGDRGSRKQHAGRGGGQARKAARPERQARNDRAIRDHRQVKVDRKPLKQAEPRYAVAERANRAVRSARYDGCPPGLAAKHNGCLPPGQAKKLVGSRLPDRYRDERLPAYYRTWYPDTDRYSYRSGDGYIYRIDRSSGLIGGLMPLLAWDDRDVDYYDVGESYPLDTYSFYNVPAAYQPYYADNDASYYRYGDGAIYQVDRGNGLVEAIVALLAGDLSVGSPMPAGYDAYNVPTAYRDQYYDTPDAWYRYNDGYIYQVDPQTRLVQAVIEALA